MNKISLLAQGLAGFAGLGLEIESAQMEAMEAGGGAGS